jgi:hypothetical protein
MARNFKCPATDTPCSDKRCKRDLCMIEKMDEERARRVKEEADNRLRRRGIIPVNPEDYGL